MEFPTTYSVLTMGFLFSVRVLD